jgi:hypothetical protein
LATLKLRPWPFAPQETVELCWFGSPFTDAKGRWRLQIALRKQDGNLEIVSYPWGTFPLLRLGQRYVNGVFDPVSPLLGHIETMRVKDLHSGSAIIGFDIPGSLMYFQKKPELGKQHVIKYEINGVDYFIPVMEWIRCLFVKNRTLAYYLLHPHGLELLVDRIWQRNDVLFLDLNRRIPEKFARPNDVLHLVWILTSPGVRQAWDSVYNSLFRSALVNKTHQPISYFRTGIPLQMELPSIGPCELTVRCIRNRNQVLVLEVLGISDLRVPIAKVVYTHPSLKKQQSIFGPKRLLLSERKQNDQYELNEQSENAKEDVHQDVLDTPPTFFGFVQMPEMIVHRKDVRNVHTGEEIPVRSGRGGKHAGTAQLVSAEDSVYGGDTPPLEFSSLQSVPAREGIGLEDFFRVIHLLIESYSFKVRMSVFRLPSGRRFSICPNGVRRTCAVVQVTTPTVQKYILEIARPDGWSISTLILTPKRQLSFGKIEHYIKVLLDGLVNKGGHWDRAVLDQCAELDIDKMKHVLQEDVRRWAERLKDKLM